MNEKRIAVSDMERNKAAQQAVAILMQDVVFSTAKNIACYLARTEEFDSTPIIQAIWAAKKNCYLPVLSSHEEGYLHFVPYQANDQLQLNKYRILEPQNKTTYPTERLDLVIMPLVGFDIEGHRLGAGGGYYDKTFAFAKNAAQKKPILMGLAYEFQCLHALPRDEWDVPMDAVVTERQIRFF